jgi:hypothetical protein
MTWLHNTIQFDQPPAAAGSCQQCRSWPSRPRPNSARRPSALVGLLPGVQPHLDRHCVDYDRLPQNRADEDGLEALRAAAARLGLPQPNP